MGTRIVRLPDIGEGIAEAELVAWHVRPGDIVREDQPLAEVMTDKATVEIPSPVTGTVIALGGEVGARLAVGSELVRLEVPGAPGEEVPPPPRLPASPPAPEPPPPAAPDAAAPRPAPP
ncbi:biotin/lipoyl-containing protein, partial [Crenalkalicoccus roseus]|uniref:biotin/lipoyl-containing protein n=1 Tax=Crenalkalicoccus roseus TaxID=1485588 RepID=UPI0030845E7B